MAGAHANQAAHPVHRQPEVVPALVGTEPGAEFEFSFEGTGCGLFITSGPDAGTESDHDPSSEVSDEQ